MISKDLFSAIDAKGYNILVVIGEIGENCNEEK